MRKVGVWTWTSWVTVGGHQCGLPSQSTYIPTQMSADSKGELCIPGNEKTWCCGAVPYCCTAWGLKPLCVRGFLGLQLKPNAMHLLRLRNTMPRTTCIMCMCAIQLTAHQYTIPATAPTRPPSTPQHTRAHYTTPQHVAVTKILSTHPNTSAYRIVSFIQGLKKLRHNVSLFDQPLG
jgi:hypothetical protein